MKELNTIFIAHPKLSDREIGRKTKLSPVTIGKYRKEFWEVMNREFADKSIKMSIFEMRRSVEHWKSLIEQHYEELKNNKKHLSAIVTENGKKKFVGTTVELSPDEKINLRKRIEDLEAKIQEYGNDPEINEILKAMQDGKIQED